MTVQLSQADKTNPQTFILSFGPAPGDSAEEMAEEETKVKHKLEPYEFACLEAVEKVCALDHFATEDRVIHSVEPCFARLVPIALDNLSKKKLISPTTFWRCYDPNCVGYEVLEKGRQWLIEREGASLVESAD